MGVPTKTVCAYLAGFFGVAGLVLMVVLLALTVNKEVAQDEYMLPINKYTGNLGEIYEQGRVNLAVGDSMITFQRTVKSYQTTLNCWSMDELSVQADITVYYQYIKDYIKPILLIEFFDEDYFNQFFYPQIQHSIISTCGNYTAEQFYQDRATIANEMFTNLVAVVSSSASDEPSPVKINQLQLQNLQFPTAFTNVLNTKSQTKAQQQTQLNARQTLLTNAQTNQIAAQKQAAIALIQSSQQANQYLAQANATKAVIIDQFEKRAVAFNEAKNRLQLDDWGLLNYIRGEMIRSNNETVLSI